MLNYIHPDNIHSHWDFVKEGIKRMHDRAADRWKQEDVYHMVKANQLGLYLVNESDGFVLLQPIRGWDGSEVYVFAAYLRPGMNFINDCFAEVKEIAKGLGAKRIKFQSKRRGWEKTAAKLGYQYGHTEYEVEL